MAETLREVICNAFAAKRGHALKHSDGEAADIVLTALLSWEPSEEVSNAAIREWVGGERYARDHVYCDAAFGDRPAKIFRAMLDAAIKEGRDG